MALALLKSRPDEYLYAGLVTKQVAANLKFEPICPFILEKIHKNRPYKETNQEVCHFMVRENQNSIIAVFSVELHHVDHYRSL